MRSSAIDTGVISAGVGVNSGMGGGAGIRHGWRRWHLVWVEARVVISGMGGGAGISGMGGGWHSSMGGGAGISGMGGGAGISGMGEALASQAWVEALASQAWVEELASQAWVEGLAQNRVRGAGIPNRAAGGGARGAIMAWAAVEQVPNGWQRAKRFDFILIRHATTVMLDSAVAFNVCASRIQHQRSWCVII